MKRPTVSLIVTTYNWEKALNLYLNSVLRQSVLPDEILVADDGSKEPTRLTVEAFARISPVPVRHIWHEDDGFRLRHSQQGHGSRTKRIPDPNRRRPVAPPRFYQGSSLHRRSGLLHQRKPRAARRVVKCFASGRSQPHPASLFLDPRNEKSGEQSAHTLAGPVNESVPQHPRPWMQYGLLAQGSAGR